MEYPKVFCFNTWDSKWDQVDWSKGERKDTHMISSVRRAALVELFENIECIRTFRSFEHFRDLIEYLYSQLVSTFGNSYIEKNDCGHSRGVAFHEFHDFLKRGNFESSKMEEALNKFVYILRWDRNLYF